MNVKTQSPSLLSGAAEQRGGLIGAALLALILGVFVALLRSYRQPKCHFCDGRDISEDNFGRCVCRACGHEWNPLKRFGSAHADL
jgi:hypothetical protein